MLRPTSNVNIALRSKVRGGSQDIWSMGLMVLHSPLRMLPPDPHGFDGEDNDGLGCESN
jgi:hypothetical protein